MVSQYIQTTSDKIYSHYSVLKGSDSQTPPVSEKYMPFLSTDR